MLKRRGTISRSGLARAAHLGFSRKKKRQCRFCAFSLFLLLFFFFFSSSSSLHPLFYSFNFFLLFFFFRTSSRKEKFQKKNRKTPEKRNFRRNLALFFFLFHVLSLLSLPFSSLFLCGEFFPLPRIASRTTVFSAACFLCFVLLFGDLYVFLLCVCAVKESQVLSCLALFVVWCGLLVNDCHCAYQKKRSFLFFFSCLCLFLCSHSCLVMVVVMVGDLTRPLF